VLIYYSYKYSNDHDTQVLTKTSDEKSVNGFKASRYEIVIHIVPWAMCDEYHILTYLNNTEHYFISNCMYMYCELEWPWIFIL